MKISKSKQELARIISENGGWKSDKCFAAQDACGTVNVYECKPIFISGNSGFGHGGGWFTKMFKEKKIAKWHQTILSREEYFHLYPATDADGWIKCNGSEPKIDQDAVVEVKFRDGQLGHNPETVRVWCWHHGDCDDDIIAYRLHKPEQQLAELCDKVTEENKHEHVDCKPTIEQLAADYHNRKDYADRKQEEADAAKADAEAKLAELVAAGKAIGLVLSVVGAEPELAITDWLDLRVGDEMECVEPAGGSVVTGSVGTIIEVNGSMVFLDFPEQKNYIYQKSHFDRGDVKFIRRP